MNLTKLRVFALTAEHGSLTKVANIMGKNAHLTKYGAIQFRR